MFQLSGWLVLTIFAVVNCQNYHSREQPPPERTRSRQRAVQNSTSLPSLPTTRHGNGEIEYRLTRLEILLVEKLENLRNEVRETSRRLQQLEWQSSETHTAMENIRDDLNRSPQQQTSTTETPITQDNQKLEFRIDNLAKGLQVLVAATRVLNSDVKVLKQNVTSLINSTRSVLETTSQLVTKQYFNNGVVDLKHHQTSSPGPNPAFCSSNTNEPPTYRNCKEVKKSGNTRSGIYLIQPLHSAKPFMVVCDLTTHDGGWTIIQNRYDGSQDFYQSWHEYKNGFGNLRGEFWLGLENLHLLTGYEVNELLIELEDFDSKKRSAFYSTFSVGSEVEGYSLKVLGGYSGDAGDSLIYHAGNRFTTRDMDQDAWPEGNCAQTHYGGWWYRSCDMSNLNGRYLSGVVPDEYIYQGMYWGEFRGAQYSLLRARILVRPREEVTSSLIDEIFNDRKNQPTSAGGQPTRLPIPL